MERSKYLGNRAGPEKDSLIKRFRRIPDIIVTELGLLGDRQNLHFFTRWPVSEREAQTIESGLDEVFDDIATVVTNHETVEGHLAVFINARGRALENPEAWWEEVVNRLEKLALP